MAVWLAALAYALPPVILLLQRLRAPRDLVPRQRVATTVFSFLAVPVSWAGVDFVSGWPAARMGPISIGGFALAHFAPSLLLMFFVLIARRVRWARFWPLALVPTLIWFAAAVFGGSAPNGPDSIRMLLASVALLAAAAGAGPAVAGALAKPTAPGVGFVAISGALLLLPAAFGVLVPFLGFTGGGLGSPASQS